jgi:succinoglycan biosynthesis protein ExoW
MKAVVVIPYFQRKPGILRRALDTVFAQRLDPGIEVDVLIVDDESPSPPELETEGLSRPGFAIKIIKRRNGGPARARNTGLAAAAGADWIAFLDSDDLWREEHLATGIAALRHGAQFYCANNRYEGDRTWFDGLDTTPAMLAAAETIAPDVHRLTRDAAMGYLLEGCLAHTSTVIADAKTIRGLRFDEEQELAGEDYLFWIGAVDRSQHVAFSMALMAERGRGVDMYRSALDWNSPQCARRLYYALLLHKKIYSRFCRTPEQKATLRGKIDLLRRGIAYLMVRNAARHPKTSLWIVGHLARNDGNGLVRLPADMVTTTWQRARGRLEFPVG